MSGPFSTPILLLAVRDTDLAKLAKDLYARRAVTKKTVVLHVAGAHGPEVLDVLRPLAAGVGQAHPLISFASTKFHPTLTGGHLLVAGDARALAAARRLARSLGMVAREWRGLDRAQYHLAAALLANGSVTLAGAAQRLLASSGASPYEIRSALGPLLRSVAENVERLGLPAALTGPIRRGDPSAVAAHLSVLRKAAPDLIPLYLASAQVQLHLTRLTSASTRQDLGPLEDLLSAAARRQKKRTMAATLGTWKKPT